MLLGNSFRAESRAQQAAEQERRIIIRLNRETIVAGHNNELLYKILDALDDAKWTQIRHATHVDMENLLCIPDHTLQIARQHDAAVACRKDLSQHVSIALQSVPFFFKL